LSIRAVFIIIVVIIIIITSGGGRPTRSGAFEVIHAALDAGINFFDTAVRNYYC
jgi:aryl-alcohol dehydrogenase-like predicted oxidoreductase